MIRMTSNKLKIIAIITMIIDHIGYYFNFLFNIEVYVILRAIGRIAMPIFTFLIVEGYFHTKDLRKYIYRISIIAIITQSIFIIIEGIFKENSYNISGTLNILFSFINLLVLFKLFENIIIKNNIISKFIFTIYILAIYLLYKHIEFDYGLYVIIIGTIMYISKKYIKDDIISNGIIIVSILIYSCYRSSIYFFTILAIPFILLYNNKLGKKNNILKYTFYVIFPVQHLLLYVISMIMRCNGN